MSSLAPFESVTDMYSLDPFVALPQAWIMGYVNTNVPGYREVEVAGRRGVAASGTYRFDAWLTALGAATGYTFFDEESHGLIVCDAPPTFWDRSGWLMGWNLEAGVASAGSAATGIPPGCIPAIGANWTDVTLDREVRSSVDRQRRSSGFVWGSARLWRVVFKMHRWSLEALASGWCLAGRVNIVPASLPAGRDTWPAWSTSAPTGYLDGYVVNGIERVRWMNRTETLAEVSLILATQV